MKLQITTFALTAMLLAASTGCISSSSTSYQDVERVRVTFETEKAGRVFYEALSKIEAKSPKEESKSSLNLIVISLESRTVTGPNKFFNQAVGACDVDQNGMISELEADIFASAKIAVR